MLKIDGSYGEGGGQILRTAVALSALTKKPIEIINIRANRPNPGIKPQHYMAIKSMQQLCDAQVDGLEVGSSKLTFIPKDLKSGRYKFDIGTAGSITLVFQTCILGSLKTKEPITINLKGGTDVKWSPSWDYFQQVFLPLLKKTGVNVNARLIKRGYYPKGGGEAEITIQPSNKIKPLKLNQKQDFSEVKGIINISNLPSHVSTRIKHTVIKTLIKKNLKSSIEIQEAESFSQGTGVTLWAESKDAVFGSTVLGERGISSEEVGEKAALDIVQEIEAGSTLDLHVFDQMLPYMAISTKNGISSCIVREVSSHAKTNMWLIRQFFDINFEVLQNKNNIVINVK